MDVQIPSQGFSKDNVSRCHVRLFGIPWVIACQAPLSMEFFRQEYWSGLPFPSPGYLPYPGIESEFPSLQADSLPSESSGKQSCSRFPNHRNHEILCGLLEKDLTVSSGFCLYKPLSFPALQNWPP